MEQSSAIRLWNRFAVGNETAMFLLNLPEQLEKGSSDARKVAGGAFIGPLSFDGTGGSVMRASERFE